MAYTTHGHHIPGTSKNEVESYAKCGGDGICTTCSAEIANHTGGWKDVLHSSLAGLDKPVAGKPVTIFDTDHLQPYVETAKVVSEAHYRRLSGRDVGDPVDYFELAKQNVRRYIEDTNDSGHDLPKFGLYVPFFTYTLGNWKATLAVDTDDVLPGAYFEVTHKSATGETFVVHYIRHRSITYTD